MKKRSISLIFVIALLIGCLVSCGTIENDTEKTSAAAVFTLDVNPGVRIYVRDDSTVITVEATNDDGEEIIAELDFENEDYETVVEEIIDKMEDMGYLEGEENSVLLSVEKNEIDISEKVNEKIEKTFEKHGKRASVIEQELDGLDEEAEKKFDAMVEKYHISKGKARLIDKIREEYPELSEEELANLKVNELSMMLEETSENIKSEFKKIGRPIDAEYIGKEQALEAAVESVEDLEISVDDITMPTVRVTHRRDKMLYRVEFVYGDKIYEIAVDAKNGEILSTEIKEFVEFDANKILDEFYERHNINPDDIKGDSVNGFFGGSHHDDRGDEGGKREPLSRGELLEGILNELEISDEDLKNTDVKAYETEIGTVCVITVETESGDVYEFIVEVYSGMIIKAEHNGSSIEAYTEINE